MSKLITHPIISVVVPVYNSTAVIKELSQLLHSVLSGLTESNYEIILVDDCSSDNTWQEIKEIAAIDPRVKACRLQRNYGQWVAKLVGVKNARGTYVVTIDDDLEYNPIDISKLFKTISTNNFKVVFGMARDKYILQGKNRYFSSLRKKILHFIWNTKTTDSFKIFHRNLVFRADEFLPDILLEAYITHTVDYKYWGYCDVSFNKRAGTSNHTFIKKLKLFLIYTTHYYKGSISIATTFGAFSSFLIFLLGYLLMQLLNSTQPPLPILMAAGIVSILTAYFWFNLFMNKRKSAGFRIADELNFN